jgi:hypothetical protein
MKYKIGDKVRYDGGDWWFYGTVSAVFEHSICPCYRLSVERMEKKNCKFSITQFEFELEASEVESGIDKREWENSEIEILKNYYGVLNNDDLSKMLKRSPQELEEQRRMMHQEPEPKKVQKHELPQEMVPETVGLTQKQEKKPFIRKTTDAWDNNLEMYRKGEKSNAVSTWSTYNRKQFKTGVLSEEKLEKLKAINFPFVIDKTKQEKIETQPIQTKEPAKRKTSEKWERNLEDYLKGQKSFAIYNWITSNRKQHQAGTLPEEKYERLRQINFRFEGKEKKVEKTPKTVTPKRKRSGDEWETNFELYQKGEKSDTISSWIASNRKEFKTGKLTEAMYEKLVRINFPFDVGQKKDDNWEKLFEEWKNGERKSVKIQQWKQRSIRQHSENKLSVDRILKLKEVGILK